MNENNEFEIKSTVTPNVVAPEAGSEDILLTEDMSLEQIMNAVMGIISSSAEDLDIETIFTVKCEASDDSLSLDMIEGGSDDKYGFGINSNGEDRGAICQTGGDLMALAEAIFKELARETEPNQEDAEAAIEEMLDKISSGNGAEVVFTTTCRISEDTIKLERIFDPQNNNSYGLSVTVEGTIVAAICQYGESLKNLADAIVAGVKK